MNITAVNEMIRLAWSRQAASPFFGQLDFDDETSEQIRGAVRHKVLGRIPLCETVFRDSPFASVWCVLNALAKNYGGDGALIYRHIGDVLGLDLTPQSDRERMKLSYRTACRNIGLTYLDPSNPTGLFFSNLGIAEAQAPQLASSLLRGARRLGPPPEEDLSEMRQWLRAATREGLENHTRLLTALANDSVAYHAQLFCDWRAGVSATNRSGTVLFEALDREARALGIDVAGIVSEPDLVWTDNGLGLLARPSRKTQIISWNGLPEKIPIGRTWRVPSPWPNTLSWSCGHTRASLNIAPKVDEILVFALDTQRLVLRTSDPDEVIMVPTREVLVLAGSAFEIEDGSLNTQSVPQGQRLPDIGQGTAASHLALAEVGPDLVLISTPTSTFMLERERAPGIRAQGPVIGRSGSMPLYGSAGGVVITTGIEGADVPRILRIGFSGKTWYLDDIVFDEVGRAKINFEDLGVSPGADPERVEVALLIKGADARQGSRAEAIGRFYLWPGTPDFNADAQFEIKSVPGNILANTSQHIHFDAAGLWIDPGHGFRHATLSLNVESRRRDFAIPIRGTRVFQNFLAKKRSLPVGLGNIVVIGHAERQDTITVRSSEKYADLHVRGAIIRRPFIARSEWEITARQLDPETPSDDRVALVYDDGRKELLCRISRPLEPHRLEIYEEGNILRATLELPVSCDAIGLEVFDERAGNPVRVQVALGTTPVDITAAGWFSASILSLDPDVVEIRIDRTAWSKNTGIGFIETRELSSSDFSRLEDSRGRAFALALSSPKIRQVSGRPDRSANLLCRVLATTYQPDCDAQIRRALQVRHQQLIASIAERGLYSPLLPLVFSVTLHGGSGFLSRLDLLHPDLAPEIFSAEESCFLTFRGTPAAQRMSYLSGIRALGIEDIPEVIREHAGDDDLLGLWLKDIEHVRPRPAVDQYQYAVEGLSYDESENSEGIEGRSLRDAFLSFRQNSRHSDFFACLEYETVGQTLKTVLDVYRSNAEELLVFDDAAGTDRTGVLLAAYLSAFAKAARSKGAGAFHEGVARRTGLPIAHVTPATSLALQVAGELFAYFMIFWTIAHRAEVVTSKSVR